LKAVSGKELCKALERRGWQLARIRGSHHIYHKPGELAVISVPVHGNRTLKTGTQRGIMKTSGVEESDL
jgi:predicted RNA binding protein YcfA (HicA-like mRNA interferase family)